MYCGGGHLGFPIGIKNHTITTWIIETKLPRNDHWKVLYKISVFYVDWKSKMAATAIHILMLIYVLRWRPSWISDRHKKYTICRGQNAFFSETTNIIKAKLYMNVHWMVLYELYVFCSDMKFKMATTAGLSLTSDPMGKMFQNAIIFVVSEKKAFEHFPIGSSVNLCIAVAAILDFRSA
jgi:hypothetical protein